MSENNEQTSNETNDGQAFTFDQLTEMCQATARSLVLNSRNRLRFVLIGVAKDIGGHMVSNFNNDTALSRLLAQQAYTVLRGGSHKADLWGNPIPGEPPPSPPSTETTDDVVTIEVSSPDEAKFVEWLIGYGLNEVGMSTESAADFAKEFFGSLRLAGFCVVSQTIQTAVSFAAKPPAEA